MQLSWLAFRELHQIRNTVRRERGMRYNEEGTRGDNCDGAKLFTGSNGRLFESAGAVPKEVATKSNV